MFPAIQHAFSFFTKNFCKYSNFLEFMFGIISCTVNYSFKLLLIGTERLNLVQISIHVVSNTYSKKMLCEKCTLFTAKRYQHNKKAIFLRMVQH